MHSSGRIYVPDIHAYQKFYSSQSGEGGIEPVYDGYPYQHGHGFGDVLGRIFKFAVPILRKVAPHAVRFGTNIADDVFNKGEKFGETLKKRGLEALSDTAEDVLQHLQQQGTGIKRPRRCQKV